MTHERAADVHETAERFDMRVLELIRIGVHTWNQLIRRLAFPNTLTSKKRSEFEAASDRVLGKERRRWGKRLRQSIQRLTRSKRIQVAENGTMSIVEEEIHDQA